MQRQNHSVRQRQGFTIIELMIIIAVIAILAAISIVSYGGIRNSSYDSAIKSDLSNLSKMSSIYFTKNNKYQNTPATLEASVRDFKIGVRDAYAQSPKTKSNLTACFTVDAQEIAFVAMSASGRVFYSYSKDNFNLHESQASQWFPDDDTAADRCKAIDSILSPDSPYTSAPMNYNGYRANDTTSGPWRKWAAG